MPPVLDFHVLLLRKSLMSECATENGRMGVSGYDFQHRTYCELLYVSECSKRIAGVRHSEGLFRLLGCCFSENKRNKSFVERIRKKEIKETRCQYGMQVVFLPL